MKLQCIIKFSNCQIIYYIHILCICLHNSQETLHVLKIKIIKRNKKNEINNNNFGERYEFS